MKYFPQYMKISFVETPKILIVEDESIVALHLQNSLQHLGYEIFGIVPSGEQAIALVSNAKPDLTIMDIQLSGKLDGIQTSEIFSKEYQIPVIFLTAYADGPTIERAKVTEPFGYLIKPFEEKDLRGTIEMALYKSKSERRLRESEERYTSLFSQPLSIVFVYDLDGNLLDVNQAFVKLFGYSKSDILTMNIASLFSFEMLEDIKEKLNAVHERELPAKINQLEIVKKNGEKAVIEMTSSLVIKNGKPVAVQCIARDVTERMIYETNLIQAKEKAEQSDKLKTEFLAQISHEIRTPINNIVTYASLLKEEIEEKLPSGLESAFKVIDSSAQRLLRTIDLILNISQIQSGSFETKFENIDVGKDILEDLIIEFYMKAKSKQLDLSLVYSGSDFVITADNYTLKQIFANLIDNAIKYSMEGSIVIKLYRNEKKEICVDVTDTGIGIAQEYIPLLFEPFTQEDTGYSRSFEGSGLGLALVQRYTEINKGHISVTSEKGRGSIFTVTFPPPLA